LADLSDDLRRGIDVSDWAPAALDAVSYNGGIYGVPMDFHANLWHVNMEIMAAGRPGEDDGTPVLPNPEELLEHAKMVKEKTGKDYLAADFAQFPIGVRLVLSLMWQQGENIFTEDGTATVDTPRPQARGRRRSPSCSTPGWPTRSSTTPTASRPS
jgi:multiple sugar transport system substrate-binding protein